MSCTHNADIGAILADCANETIAVGADPFSCAIAEVSVALVMILVTFLEDMQRMNKCELSLTVHRVGCHGCLYNLSLTVHWL